ncbi:MAG: ParB N-terminal domain-containing protein [Planctomycetaceae bacterium]
MHLRTLPVAQLRPAPYNPRKPLTPGSPGYRRLARSIDEFDLVQPVVWNERTGHVVAGHQRVAVLTDRGALEIECVVVDLPLSKEKALNVALNNAAVGSTWDDDKLHELLAELSDLPDLDATLTGFDAAELNDLLLAPLPELPAASSNDDDAQVRVTLVVAPDRWDAVRPDLDELVATHDLETHVRLPH